jgi:hypothetical protein
LKPERSDIWYNQPFRRFYSYFGEGEPARFDILSYAALTLLACLYFGCTFVIYVVLNFASLPLGVYAEPEWEPDARFRKLRFPGGIPVIGVATPLWLFIAAWQNWLACGLGLTLAPFLMTAGLGFGLLAFLVALNKLRASLPTLVFPGTDAPPND